MVGEHEELAVGWQVEVGKRARDRTKTLDFPQPPARQSYSNEIDGRSSVAPELQVRLL